MKRILLTTLLLTTAVFAIIPSAFAQSKKRIAIGKELTLIRVSPNLYIHESWMNEGTTPCNGMLYHHNGKALLVETAYNDSVTQVLLDYIRDVLKLQVTDFLTNDWHRDSMGGLKAVKQAGIKSYAHDMTREIAKLKNLPLPDQGYRDSFLLVFENHPVHCYYFGAAHTTDNVVTWFPDEDVLFAGCMVKEKKARDIGYTADGDIKSYPDVLKKVAARFGKVKTVVPGHGAPGGPSLIEHTLSLVPEK